MQYKPFHNQQSKLEFVELIKELIGVAVNDWKQQLLGTEVELSAFKGIVLQDGSSFAVHDSLKDISKGHFTKISPAVIEVHVSWYVLRGYPEQVPISPDSQAEYDFLPDADALAGRLLLADRGYFKLSYLDEIDQSGGAYVVRAQTTVNPVVVAGFNKAVKKHIRRSGIVDMDVEGKTNYRLIASWQEEKDEPTYWATNLNRE